MKGEKDENLYTKTPGFWKPKTNPPSQIINLTEERANKPQTY